MTDAGDAAEPPSAFAEWAYQLSLAEAVRASDWAYPVLETVHMIGIAMVFAPIVLFDLRVLGTNRDVGLQRLRRLLLPWVWFGFILNAVSGGAMFASDAIELSRNPAFLAKLGLIGFAGLNALLFSWRLLPRPVVDDEPSCAAKASAALSIGLWIAVITAGRMMAYIK